MYFKRFGLDANIVISGLFFGGSLKPFFAKIARAEVEVYLSEFVRDEVFAFIAEHGLSPNSFEKFLGLSNVRVVLDSSYAKRELFDEAKRLVRDESDWPVFAFAKHLVENNVVTVFLTGDNDLLTVQVRRALDEKILSPSELAL